MQAPDWAPVVEDVPLEDGAVPVEAAEGTAPPDVASGIGETVAVEVASSPAAVEVPVAKQLGATVAAAEDSAGADATD